jgi:hypothetical protein
LEITMASEAKRGLIRIVANYTRVVLAVVLALLVVRLLLAGIGNDGWALIALLGSTVGLASTAQQIVRASMIRELGAAYHSARPADFPATYNAAMAVAVATAALIAVVFTVLWFIVPVLRIPPHLIDAARWIVVARGAETVVVLVLAAPFNMYKVAERMVAYNGWLIMNRVCHVVAATGVLFLLRTDDPATGVTVYALCSSGLIVGTIVVASLLMVVIDRRTLPAPSAITRDALKSVLQIGGWNAAATTATLLHYRAGEIIMNLAFGLFGNLIFGLGYRLTDAVRRLAMGMTEGLDAVSARLSTTRSDDAVRTLIHHSTRLHGLATFPAAVLVFFLAEPLLLAWVGNGVEDPGTAVPMTVMLVRVMTLGMIARAISEGWIRILYGAGHVTRYAPLIVLAGVANPLLAIVLLLVLPDPVRYTAVAWAYSGVLVTIHFGLVPLVGAKALHMRYGQMLVPLLRPLIIALACSPILVIAFLQTAQWDVLRMGLAVAGFGFLYLGLSWIFVVDRAERARFMRAALKHLPRRA